MHYTVTQPKTIKIGNLLLDMNRVVAIQIFSDYNQIQVTWDDFKTCTFDLPEDSLDPDNKLLQTMLRRWVG